MDEREVANHVLAVVDQAAYKNSAHRIVGLRLAVGGRRVLDPDRLRTVFREAARGTVAEGAELFVEVLPVRHHCQNCGHNFDAGGGPLPCPKCDHPHTEFIGGEELRLRDMELEDAA